MVASNVVLPQRPDANIISGKKSSQKWNLVRDVVSNTVESTFTNRNGTSLTAQETSFLQLLETSKEKRLLSLKNKTKPAFLDVVSAAVARDKLRDDLSNRLSKLTATEAQFLKELVESEEVTAEQLNHADHVLNTDPLYQLPDEEEIHRKKTEDGDAHVDYLELAFSQDNRCRGLQVDLEKQHPLNRTKHYINMFSKEIEVSLTPNKRRDDDDECRDSPDATLTPTVPSKYSYRTWEQIMVRDKVSDFTILGMPDSIAEKDRVLSPPMMDSLRKHLPFAVSEDNFWLKYNMTRDGSSIHSLYNSVRQSSRTLIAIETTDGEVFGCVVSSPWRNNNDYYGSCEAFLWRMKQSRFVPTLSLNKQIELESDIETFLWSTENRNIQFSTQEKIAIGGGYPDDDDDKEGDQNKKWGLGIALDGELYKGTSSPCITFGDNTNGSPSLFQASSQGDIFEVANMEVWSFTPCFAVDKAEQLEMGRMFVLSHF